MDLKLNAALLQNWSADEPGHGRIGSRSEYSHGQSSLRVGIADTLHDVRVGGAGSFGGKGKRCDEVARKNNGRHLRAVIGCIAAEAPSVIILVATTLINAVVYGSLANKAFKGVGAQAPDGVTMWLLAASVGQLAVTSVSALPFAVCFGTVEMLPIVHSIIDSIVATMNGEDPEAILGTCIVTIFSATLTLGLLLLIAGSLRLSKWLRVVPIVVLKGALFGISLYLLQSAVESSVAVPDGKLLRAWPHWALVVALGTAVFFLDEVMHSPVTIVAVLLIISIAPVVSSLVGGPSLEELQDGGWLMSRGGRDVGGGTPRQPWYAELFSMYTCAFTRVNLSVVWGHTPAVMGLWFTHALCTLTDLKAVELITRTDVDLDVELRALGLANVFSALSGGLWPVYALCSQTVSNKRLGTGSRVAGVAKLVAALPMLYIVRDVVPLLPCALPGCVTWWIGMLFMKETAFDVAFQHSHGVDVAIVVATACVVMLFGLLQGILFGLLLALLAFTQQYSGLAPVVRACGDASFFQSNTMRSYRDDNILQRLGHRIHVIFVEGYLMFGSSPQLVDVVRPLLLRTDGPRWLVLCFRGVRGVDYSAICDLASLGGVAASLGKCIILTEIRRSVRLCMDRAGIKLTNIVQKTEAVFLQEGGGICEQEKEPEPTGLCHVEHYQEALRFCENAVILSVSSATDGIAELLDDHDRARAVIAKTIGDFMDGKPSMDQSVEELLAYFDRVEFPPGSTVFSMGETATRTVCILRGELRTLQPAVQTGHEPWVMEVASVGSFVGFLCLQTEMPYSASVVVPSGGSSCICLVLRKERLADLEAQRPFLFSVLLRTFLKRMSHEYQVLARLAAMR
eukprot:TRINITY_DN6545_c0_g1_i6.p1 TRINITY_DN6545_c0_g1~~TRINITY_DN6545_c0_g1_i6.p1  ORF type:complete len:852 (-),score=102.65 TRINITY_DN6545_c0_g1_i6:155-2710(-)